MNEEIMQPQSDMTADEAAAGLSFATMLSEGLMPKVPQEGEETMGEDEMMSTDAPETLQNAPESTEAPETMGEPMEEHDDIPEEEKEEMEKGMDEEMEKKMDEKMKTMMDEHMKRMEERMDKMMVEMMSKMKPKE